MSNERLPIWWHYIGSHGAACFMLALRNSIERPETVILGTNELIGDDFAKLEDCLGKIVKGDWKKGTIPEFWDGKTAERIVEILQSIYSRKLQLQ